MCWVTPKDSGRAHSNNAETEMSAREDIGVENKVQNVLMLPVESRAHWFLRYYMNKADVLFVDVILT